MKIYDFWGFRPCPGSYKENSTCWIDFCNQIWAKIAIFRANIDPKYRFISIPAGKPENNTAPRGPKRDFFLAETVAEPQGWRPWARCIRHSPCCCCCRCLCATQLDPSTTQRRVLLGLPIPGQKKSLGIADSPFCFSVFFYFLEVLRRIGQTNI